MKKFLAWVLILAISVTSILSYPIESFAEESKDNQFLEAYSDVSENDISSDDILIYDTFDDDSCDFEGIDAETYGEDELIKFDVFCDGVTKTFKSYNGEGGALAYLNSLGNKDVVFRVYPRHSEEINPLPTGLKSLKLSSYFENTDERQGSFYIDNASVDYPLIIDSNVDFEDCNLNSVIVEDCKREYDLNEIELENTVINSLEMAEASRATIFGTDERVGSFKGEGSFYISMSGDDSGSINIDKLLNENGVLTLGYYKENIQAGDVIATVGEGLKEVKLNNGSSDDFFLAVKDNDDGTKSVIFAEDETGRIKVRILRDGEVVVDWKSFSSEKAIDKYLSSLSSDDYSDCDFYFSVGDDIPANEEEYMEYLSFAFYLPTKAKSVNFIRNELYDFKEYEQSFSPQFRDASIGYPINAECVSISFYRRVNDGNQQNIYTLPEFNFRGTPLPGNVEYEDELGNVFTEDNSDYCYTSLSFFEDMNIGKLNLSNTGRAIVTSNLNVGELTVGNKVDICIDATEEYNYDTYGYDVVKGLVTVESAKSTNPDNVIEISFRMYYNGSLLIKEGDPIFIIKSTEDAKVNIQKFHRDGYYSDIDLVDLVKDTISKPGYTIYSYEEKKIYRYRLSYESSYEDFYKLDDLMEKIYENNDANIDYSIVIEKIVEESENKEHQIGNYENIPAKSITIEVKDYSRLDIVNCGIESEYVPTFIIKNTKYLEVFDSHFDKVKLVNSTLSLRSGMWSDRFNIIKDLSLDDVSSITVSEHNPFIEKLSLEDGAIISFDNSSDGYTLNIGTLISPNGNLVIDFYVPQVLYKGYEVATVKEGLSSVSLANEEFIKKTLGYELKMVKTAENTIIVVDEAAPAEKTYTISYDPMGGILPDDTVYEYVASKGLAELPTPFLEDGIASGFRFAGWYKSAAFKSTELVKSIPVGTKINYVLYAKWIPDTYKIVFNKNDAQATGTMSAVTVRFYDKVTLPGNAFKKSNAVFAGWSTEPGAKFSYDETYITNKASVINLAVMGSEDQETVTLYAVWKDTVHLTLDSKGGEIATDKLTELSYPEIVSLDGGLIVAKLSMGKDYSLPTPVKEGYTFAGWYLSGKKYTSVSKKQTSDIKLTAKWTPYSLTIKYNGNGSNSGKMKDTKTDYSTDSVVLSNNIFIKKGYKFVGWSVSKDAEVIFTDCDEFDAKNYITTNKSVLTLYAVWEATDYTVEFFDDDLSPLAIDFVYTYGEAKALPIPEKNNYVFKGWYTDSKYKNKASITNKTYGNLKLYAKWDASYTVVYHDNGQTGSKTMKEKSMSYSVSKALDSNVFTKTGYVFMGWSTVENGPVVYKNKDKVYMPTINFNETKNTLDLYAVWENVFAVRFEFNASPVDVGWYEENGYSGDVVTNENSQTVNYVYGSAYSLPVPEKYGYTFGGWFTDTKYKNKAVLSNKSSGNKVFYAKWNALKYTITYNNNVPLNVKAKAATKKQTMAYGSGTKLTQNGFKITGYTFLGWAAEKKDAYSEEDIIYGNNVECTDKVVIYLAETKKMSNVTLYAVWEKTEYQITYVNCENVREDTEEWTYVYYVDSPTVVLPSVHKVGYTFAGWYTDAKCTKRAKDIAKGSTGNKVFYAKWVLNK